MRFKKAGLSAAVVLAIGTLSTAQAQDSKAAEVLAATRQAIGGRKLEALRSLSVDAAIQRHVGNMQMASQAELLIELPDKYVRSETTSGLMNMTMSTGFNGERGILPAGGAVSMAPGGGMMFRLGAGGVTNEGPKPTPEQLEETSRAAARAQKVEISRLMLGWFGMAHPAMAVQYTYAGEAESPDGKAHVIDVKDAGGFTARLFIDQNSHLPLMITWQGRVPRVMTAGGPRSGDGGQPHAVPSGQTRRADLSPEELKKLQADTEREVRQILESQPLVDLSLFFDDWREVDGIRFPHVMRRAAAGTTNEEWTVTRVKVNPKLDAKKFAVETK
jgi:hypothetical protein